MRRVLALLACLAAAPALATDAFGQGRVWAGFGVDGNPHRDFVNAGQSTNGDGFGFVHLGLEGGFTGESGQLLGSYDVAGRKFARAASEDTLIQNANVEARFWPARVLSLGVSGRVRDRRGAERDYTDLVGQGVVDFSPDASLGVRLEAGAHRFLFLDRFPYSHFGPTGTLSVRARPWKKHLFTVFGTFEPRTFNGRVNPRPGDEAPPDPAPTRTDGFIVVGATWTWKGPVIVTAGYSYLEQDSNSFGETQQRHRLTATAGVRLPWKLFLMGTAALQVAHYPDGVYLSEDLGVADDDENGSSLTLKLVRPIDKHLDVDLRCALYWNTLPPDFSYFRQVVQVGLTFNF